MNLVQALQITAGTETLATLAFVIVLMAKNRRKTARKLSMYTIGLLALFVLATALKMTI